MRTELRRIATERCAMSPARHCETERFAGLSSWTPPGSPRGVREADTGAQGHMSKDRTDPNLSDAYEEAPHAEAAYEEAPEVATSFIAPAWYNTATA